MEFEDTRTNPICVIGHVAHPATTKELRSLIEDHARVKRRVVVSSEPRARRREDAIDIPPFDVFVQRLWDDALI